MILQKEKELDSALQERDLAQGEADRLSKEALAHKYTVQSLRDQISQLENEKASLEAQLS